MTPCLSLFHAATTDGDDPKQEDGLMDVLWRLTSWMEGLHLGRAVVLGHSAVGASHSKRTHRAAATPTSGLHHPEHSLATSAPCKTRLPTPA